MVKLIYETELAGGTDDTNIPNESTYIQTSESNLDIINFGGSKNLDLNNLDDFEFYGYDGVLILKGTIRDTNNGGFNSISGFDYGIELGEIPVRKNFENYTPLEIMEYVITNFTSLTYVSNSNIIDGPALKLYPSQNKKAIEIIDFCHKLLNTTHYVDNDKNFMPEYEGEELNTITLEVGVNCDVIGNGWTSSTLMLVNNLTVNGGIKDTTETKYLSGDGVTKEFELSNPYTGITIEYPLGTELTPKLEDSQDGDYEIFKETKKILFDTITPVSGTNNILFTLTYQLQANYTINAVNKTEILAGTNPHHKIINEDSLKEVVDCKRYAEKYRNKFKNPIRSAKLVLNTIDISKFRANQRILVKDSLHTINGSTVNDTFIIKSITRTFGEGMTGLVLEVGDSTQFSYNKAAEIGQKVSDLNETNPTAEIFNEGISMLSDVEIDVQVEVSTIIKVATLPSNIMVSDQDRPSINEVDHITANDGYVSINKADYEALFEEIT